MKDIVSSKLQHLLFVLLLVALTGCGANNTGHVTPPGDASIIGSVQWPGNTKTTGSVPDAVKTLRFSVTAKGIPPLTKTFFAPFSDQQQVDGIYPSDNLSITAVALDGTMTPLYEGAVLGVVLGSGETKNLGNIVLSQPTVKPEEQNCIQCHANTISSISGRNLVADYKQSEHYINTAFKDANGIGAGCVGCHGPAHNFPSPDGSRCFECHSVLGPNHQNAASTTVPGPARYLNAANNNCSACHEPHNPINGIGHLERQDWADSGHGDLTSPAWMHQDFNTQDTCNACHTPAGFVKAVGDGWSDTSASTLTSGKQPLTCDGCHSSNDFKNSVRTLANGYQAGMGGYGSAADASIQFPNVGESNVCIPCHAGRDNGASMVAQVSNFADASFVSPHYLGAAAVFYGKGGFQFYTSGVRYNTYGAAGKVGRNANWSHGQLGMDNYTTAASSSKPGVIVATGNKGQCIACHLGPTNTHSFDAIVTANATQGTSGNTQGCYGCHNGTSESMSDFVNGERVIWARGFDFFAWNFSHNADGSLRSNPIYYSSTAVVPFYSNAGMTFEVTDWTKTVPGGTGAQTMGAAMNLELLTSEKGSFMHNRSFGRALMADSIVYLQKGAVGSDRTVLYPSPNNIVSFTAYSTAKPAPDSNGVSITALKGLLTKSSGGSYFRR